MRHKAVMTLRHAAAAAPPATSADNCQTRRFITLTEAILDAFGGLLRLRLRLIRLPFALQRPVARSSPSRLLRLALRLLSGVACFVTNLTHNDSLLCPFRKRLALLCALHEIDDQ